MTVCYICGKPASCKLGIGNINLIRILRGKAWRKVEIYLCKECYLNARNNPNFIEDLEKPMKITKETDVISVHLHQDKLEGKCPLGESIRELPCGLRWSCKNVNIRGCNVFSKEECKHYKRKK